MDGDGGYKAICMYLVPLRGTLEMVKLVNFKLCVFYHNKNWKKICNIFINITVIIVGHSEESHGVYRWKSEPTHCCQKVLRKVTGFEAYASKIQKTKDKWMEN